MPFLVRMAVCENFRVGLGPSIAWLAKVEESWEDIDVTNPNAVFTKMDYGVNGDMSYSFKRFEFGARYNYGFRMIKYTGDADPEIVGRRDVHSVGKNRTLQVYVTYVFRR